MSASASKDAYPTDARVSEVVARRRLDPAILGYGACWAAVDKIAPTVGAEALVTAAIHLSAVARAVPWALDEWIAFEPAIVDLNNLARFLPQLNEDWRVPAKGVTNFAVYSALRIHSNAQRYDHHARALLISVWVRFQHPELAKDPTVLQGTESVIPTLRVWITALNDKRVRPKRDGVLREAMKDSYSLADFAIATALNHLDDLDQRSEEERGENQGLTNVLAVQVPRILGLPPLIRRKINISTLPEAEPEPSDAEFVVRNSSIDSPLAEFSDYPDDNLEDRINIQHVKILEKRRTKPLHRIEMLRVRNRTSRLQRVSSPGGLFAGTHHECLTPEEAESVAHKLLELINRHQNSDIFLAGAFVLLALTLCTGLTMERILSALNRRLKDRLPHIDADRLHLKSMLPRAAVMPEEADSDLYESTNASFSVPLPPLVARLLTAKSLYRNLALMSRAQTHLRAAILHVRQETGSPVISRGRIRKTYAIRVFESSWNYPETSLLSQDTFSQSDAPMYYYSAPSDILANIYCRAIWTLFGDRWVTSKEESSRVGSKVMPTIWTLKDFVGHPSAPLMRGIVKTDLTSVATAHNSMMSHLAAILQAIGGHRPNNSLFQLTRWDFSISNCAAIIADKQSDPAHARRLIGLGELGARQVALYIKHLQELAELELDQGLTAYIRNKVLLGKEPLLFRLAESGQVEPADMQWFRETVAKAPDIKLNYGRHVLASLGRQMDKTRADLLGIHLGHYESTGFPFSADSPLSPLSYLKRLNPILDEIFRHQKWKLRTGLAHPDDRTRKLDRVLGTDWTSTGKLRSWQQQKKTFNRVVADRNRKVRLHWRAQIPLVRLQVEQEVVDTAYLVNGELATLIAWRVQERRVARLKDRAQPVLLPHGRQMPERGELPIFTDSDAIDALLERLDERYREATYHAIAAHNTVARVLLWAAAAGVYTGRRYWPYLPLRPLDPSPFIPGLFRATEQIRCLRDDFEALSDCGLDKPQATLAKAILAAVVYAGVDSAPVLKGLFLESCQCWRVPAIPDALLIRVDSLAYVVALRGPSAVCYAKWRRSSEPVQDSGQILEALRSTFPDKPWVQSDRLLERLTGTQEIANRIVRSPIANLALSLEEGATNLDPDQLEVLLGHAPADQDDPPEVDSSSLKVAEPITTTKDGLLAHLNAQIKTVRKLLSATQSDIQLQETGEIFRWDRANKPTEREKLLRELEACKKRADWLWYSRLWAAWAANEMTRPKLRGSGTLQLSSVRKAFTLAEKRLTREFKKFVEDTQTLPITEDLERLYHRVLENTPESSAADVCKALLSVHAEAVVLLGAEEADPSDYWEYYRPNRKSRAGVRNRIATNYQIESISNSLLAHSHPDADLSCFVSDNRRLILQAALAFHLAMATGARMREILSRQTKDVLLLLQETALIIRPNSMTNLKTGSARRLVDLSGTIDRLHRELLKNQVESEKQRFPKRQQTRLWLFSEMDGRAVPSQSIRDIVNKVSRRLLGRPFRWHSLRRRWVCDQYSRHFLSLGLQDFCEESGYDWMTNEGLVTPRDLATIRHQVGHAGHRLTIETYLHVPWIFQIREQHAEWSPDRLSVCNVMTRESARVHIQGASSQIEVTDRLLTRFGQSLPASMSAIPMERVADIPVPDGVARYCWALHDLATGITHSIVKTRYAVSDEEIERMRFYSHLLARRSGIAIGLRGKHGQIRLSKPPRLSVAGKRITGIWSWGGEEQRAADYQALVQQWADHIEIDRTNRSLMRLPTRFSLPISVLTALDLEAEEVERTEAYASYKVKGDASDVTSAMVWTLAISWIVSKAAG